MKIIHRAILKELVFTFSLSLISLNFFLLMEKVLRLSRLLSGVGASVMDMSRLVLYLQPQLMMLTLPMSLLLAVLLTYGRLNADSELTALKAAGMSFRDISMPVFFLGTGCFLFGLLISFYLSPLSANKLRGSISNIIMQRAPMAIETGIFNTSFKDIVLLVRDKPSPDTLKGIFIYDNRNRKAPRVLVAKEGRLQAGAETNLSLYIKDGFMHIAQEAQSRSQMEIYFEGYNLSLNLSFEGPLRKNSELTPAELLREAEGKDSRERLNLLLEFHRRLSLPSACLFLMLLGPPLSLLFGRSGRLGGLTLGLATFTLFYLMLIYGENLARSGNIPHYAGAWASVVVIGISSAWVFRRAGSV